MTEQTAGALVCAAIILAVVVFGTAVWIAELKYTIRRLRTERVELMRNAVELQTDNSRLAAELDQARRSGTVALLHERIGDRP